jgi:hypothetical protein
VHCVVGSSDLCVKACGTYIGHCSVKVQYLTCRDSEMLTKIWLTATSFHALPNGSRPFLSMHFQLAHHHFFPCTSSWLTTSFHALPNGSRPLLSVHFQLAHHHFFPCTSYWLTTTSFHALPIRYPLVTRILDAIHSESL